MMCKYYYPIKWDYRRHYKKTLTYMVTYIHLQ